MAHWLRTGKRSMTYIRNSQRLLLRRMADGWDLIGTNLVKHPFTDAVEECVVENALQEGLIKEVARKRYAPTEAGVELAGQVVKRW